MIYLGRTIIPITPNWADAINRQISYDLRESDIGFGPEYFTPLADYTVNAWDISLNLNGAADILTWESFCDSQAGRLNGFWLPTPLDAAEFVAGISTTQFDIAAEDLTTTWNERPDVHLLLTFPDGNQYAAQINAVADNGNGTERITLTAAIASVPPAGTRIQRLHFVRFGSDEEQLNYFAPNVANTAFTVIELPKEYTAAATGLQPVYLYEISADAPVNKVWRYTSFAANVVSNNQLFTVWPMNHGEIVQATDGQDYPVSIDARPDAAHPFSLLAGVPPGKVVWIKIYSVQLEAPDARTTIFSGFITSVADDGLKYTAKCSTRLAWLQTKLPRFYIGSSCNHILFEPNTCRARRALFETTVTYVKDVAGDLPQIEVSFDFAFHLEDWQKAGWFAQGIIETGLGTDYEIRSVVYSSWNGTRLVVTLNAWFNQLVAGQKLQIVAGCDHESETCINKFQNFENFGGFVAVPDRNLTLKGLNTNVSAGNKK